MTDLLIVTNKPDCPDCGAQVGQLHSLNCDVEQCRNCGGQALQCYDERSCPHCGETAIHVLCAEDDEPRTITDADRLRWTGEWPGVEACREFGWYSYFVPYGNPPWVRCDKDHPGAHEDLNRLHSGEARWNRETAKWERQDGR